MHLTSTPSEQEYPFRPTHTGRRELANIWPSTQIWFFGLCCIPSARAYALLSAAGFNPEMSPRGIISSLFSSSGVHPCLDAFGPSNYINTVASVLSHSFALFRLPHFLRLYTLRHMFFFVCSYSAAGLGESQRITPPSSST